MSRFNRGSQGGGGVRPGGTPPQPSGGFAGGQRERPEEPTGTDLWPNYLQGGYFDAAGNIRLDYVSRHLEADPTRGVERMVRELKNAPDKPLTMTQLRRFFQHCRRVETRLRAGQARWEQVRADIRFIETVAAYSYDRRANQRIPELFYDFVRLNVAAIKTEDDFLRGFLPHFETLVGYGALHLEKERS